MASTKASDDRDGSTGDGLDNARASDLGKEIAQQLVFAALPIGLFAALFDNDALKAMAAALACFAVLVEAMSLSLRLASR